MSDDHQIVSVEAVQIQQADDSDVPLHPFVIAAQAHGGMTPENIERMMDLQERHEARIAKHEFDSARSRLLANLPPVIKKNRRVSFGNTQYSYADLPQVMRSVMPALEMHGFSVSWRNESEKHAEGVTCILSHRSGHEVRNTRNAAVESKKGQSAVQSAQSTVTYLQRQTLLAILGIVTDDMPDADEPPAEQSPDDIDPQLTLRALTGLRNLGVSTTDAVTHVGRPVDQWTVGDFGRLKAWAKGAKENINEASE